MADAVMIANFMQNITPDSRRNAYFLILVLSCLERKSIFIETNCCIGFDMLNNFYSCLPVPVKRIYQGCLSLWVSIDCKVFFILSH